MERKMMNFISYLALCFLLFNSIHKKFYHISMNCDFGTSATALFASFWPLF